VRVREELTHHPKGTRLVAEGHVGKAATGTGGPASNREPELVAAIRGKNLSRLPDEGLPEFTFRSRLNDTSVLTT